MSLHLVAELMDDFTRIENHAYHHEVQRLQRLVRDQQVALQLATGRIRELEWDLLDSEERLRIANEFTYRLEVSILECDHHNTIPYVPTLPVRRRLTYEESSQETEVIDLTSEDEDM